jgi:Zn-dependent protease with chaperone function
MQIPADPISPRLHVRPSGRSAWQIVKRIGNSLALRGWLVLFLCLACPLLAVAEPAAPYHLPPDKLAQATALGYIRTTLHFGSELWELALLVLLVASGTAARLAGRITARVSGRRRQSALFALELIALLWLLAELPLAALSHAASVRYGISVQAWGPWLLDEVKSFALAAALETSALMLVFGLMHWTWSRRWYWAWFAAFTVPAMIAGTVLLPTVIEPMFDTFTPLSETHPALVAQLERVVARTGTQIPPERMFLMHVSAKSNGLNAYVTGLGPSKRIVVWDTTADRMPMDEILFTFGHESGHYVLNHIVKGLTLAAAGIFALAALSAWLAGALVRRWGGSWGIPAVNSLAGIAVLLLAVTILQTATEPIQNLGSRFVEHEADVYGQEAIHGIVADPQKAAVAAFNDLGAAYLDDPDPNPFVEFWSFDHPSIQTRATFATQYDPWGASKALRFFSK